MEVVGARSDGVVVSGEGVVVVFGSEEGVGIGLDGGGLFEKGLG